MTQKIMIVIFDLNYRIISLIRFIFIQTFFLLQFIKAEAQLISEHNVPMQAAPAIFYLDALGGNDNNAGTSPNKAWKTLERVNEHVFLPGDKLLLKAGRIYEGQLKLQGSGKMNSGVPQMITVDSFSKGYKPRIQANGLYNAAIYLFNTEYIQINNLDVSNYGTERAAKRTGILVHLKDYGTAHSIYLKDMDVHHVNGSLVKKEGGGAGIIFQNEGRNTPSRFDSITIENCSVKYCERNGILINGNWNRTTWFPNLHVTIRNNLLEGVPGDGIVPIGCDGALIEYNTMRDCPRLLPDGEAAAGIWPWSCDNTVVQFNEVSDHKAPWDGQGFDSDWNCNNTLIQYNYSHDNEGGFLLVCNDGNVGLPSSMGNRGTIVRYNVSVNDGLRTKGKHAGFSPVIHFAGPVRNTKVYNNVLYIPERTKGTDSTIIHFDDWGGFADSSLFANNIFYVKGTGDYVFSKSTNYIFSNNLYFGKQLNLPQDKNAIFADPLFVTQPILNVSGLQSFRQFKLQPFSKARGNGMLLMETDKKDLFGNKISGVANNIGVDQSKTSK
jgi:hypothetical protein